MKNIRFFALVSILSMLLFPLFAFAENGPHGDEGLLSAREMRAVVNAGGKVMSQSNVLSGGQQVRFGQNGAEPNMNPIRAATYNPCNGGVGMGDLTGTVDKALRTAGSYNIAGGTQVFSAQTISNAVRFSGANQLQQNTAVSANALSFPAQAYQNHAYGGQNPTFTNAVNAILGLKADPVGVASHARMFADYSAKNPAGNVLLTNDVLKNAGYQVSAFLPNVNPVTAYPAGAVLTTQPSAAGVITNQSKAGADNTGIIIANQSGNVVPYEIGAGVAVNKSKTGSAGGKSLIPNQTEIKINTKGIIN